MTTYDQLLLDIFLAKHCTGQDDHDAIDCKKCAEMKAELITLIERVAQMPGKLRNNPWRARF